MLLFQLLGLAWALWTGEVPLGLFSDVLCFGGMYCLEEYDDVYYCSCFFLGPEYYVVYPGLLGGPTPSCSEMFLVNTGGGVVSIVMKSVAFLFLGSDDWLLK